MAIKTRPPMACTLLSKNFPSLLPKLKPVKDNRNVTRPIAITGVVIDTLSKEKLNPTANASMLVAIERIYRTEAVSLVSFSSFGLVLAA